MLVHPIAPVGDAVGDAVGDVVGLVVGDVVGDDVGDVVGLTVGEDVWMNALGDNVVGESVGEGVVGKQNTRVYPALVLRALSKAPIATVLPSSESATEIP